MDAILAVMNAALFWLGVGTVVVGAYGIVRTLQVWPRAQRPELGLTMLVQWAAFILIGEVIALVHR